MKAVRVATSMSSSPGLEIVLELEGYNLSGEDSS